MKPPPRPFSSVASPRRQNPRDYSDDEQHGEQNQRLLREHSQHHECLVAGRCNHHRDERSEAEQPVGVERDRRESADAARNQSESRAEYHLSEPCSAQAREKPAVRLDVQRLNHHHHHDYESRDKYAVAQDVYDCVKETHSACDFVGGDCVDSRSAGLCRFSELRKWAIPEIRI